MARGFDGNTANYLSYGAILKGAPPITLSAWVNVNASVSGPGRILSISDEATFGLAMDLYYDDSTTQVYAHHYAGSLHNQSVCGGTTISTGTWYHVCARIVSASSIFGYLDGTAGTEGIVGAGSNTTGDITSIGVYGFSAKIHPFYGSIAFPAIWDVALDATEISTLANGAHPLLVRPGKLLAYWPLNTDGNEPGVVGDFLMTETGTVTSTADPTGITYPSALIPVITPAAGSGITRSPGAGALTLAGQTPTVSLEFVRAPGAGSLTIAGQTPSITVGSQVGARGRQRMQMGGFFGPFLTPGGVTGSPTRNPAAGALVIAGQTPSVTLNFRRAPAAGALTIAGQTPSTALDLRRSPGAGALTLTGQTPTIALDLRRAPGAGALTITGQTPSILRSIDRMPSAGSLTLAGVAPSISFNFVRSPAAGALTLAGLAPAVQSEPEAEAEPEAEPSGAEARGGMGGGAFPGRRRREDERLPTSRTYGPTLDEDEETEEQPSEDEKAVALRARQDIDAQIAELETLRTALTEDSDRVVALEGQLDDIDLRITELQQEKQMFLLLLLLIE